MHHEQVACDEYKFSFQTKSEQSACFFPQQVSKQRTECHSVEFQFNSIYVLQGKHTARTMLQKPKEDNF